MAENAIATVLGGFFAQYSSSLSQIRGVSPARRRIEQLLARKGLRDLRARITATDGVVVGSNATALNRRVDSNQELGGVRAIEIETLINRNTVVNDPIIAEATVFGTMTSRTSFGASPIANLDGNPLGTR